MEEMLDALDEYFKKTPKDKLEERFERYNKATYEGVSVSVYLQNFAKKHGFLPAILQKDRQDFDEPTK